MFIVKRHCISCSCVRILTKKTRKRRRKRTRKKGKEKEVEKIRSIRERLQIQMKKTSKSTGMQHQIGDVSGWTVLLQSGFLF